MKDTVKRSLYIFVFFSFLSLQAMSCDITYHDNGVIRLTQPNDVVIFLDNVRGKIVKAQKNTKSEELFQPLTRICLGEENVFERYIRPKKSVLNFYTIEKLYELMYCDDENVWQQLKCNTKEGFWFLRCVK